MIVLIVFDRLGIRHYIERKKSVLFFFDHSYLLVKKASSEL